MKMLVMGGGAQGSAAAFDLVRNKSVERVVVADRVGGAPASTASFAIWKLNE